MNLNNRRGKMIINRFNSLMIMCILLLSSSIHAGEPTALEKDFGQSFDTVKAAQILNPEAGKNTSPPLGLDGNAGAEVMNQYYKSFKKAEPTVTNIINIGGEGSAIGGSQ
jgi:hypothetical protein